MSSKNSRATSYVDAISSWFFSGAKRHPNGIEVDGKNFVAKEGVDAAQALRADPRRACVVRAEA